VKLLGPIWDFIVLHHWALICYGSFVFGQFCFLLKRANSAKQNQGTAVTSSWQFFRLSAIPIFVRGVLEFFGFLALRHYPKLMVWLIGLWGWTLPAGAASAINQPIFFVFWFFAGYAADSIMDRLSVAKQLPQAVRDWIHEIVPRNQFYDDGNGAQTRPGS
jgi:hypothetical protein